MKNIRNLPCEHHFNGKLRTKQAILPEKLVGVIDHATACGWHECNDRYVVRRELPPDLCSTDLVIFTLAGEGQACVEKESFRPSPGTVMIFPKNRPHSYRVPPGGQWEFYWAHLAGRNCEALLDYLIREHGNCFEISCMEEIADCMETLITTEYRYYEYELLSARLISSMLLSLMGGVHAPDKSLHQRKELTLEVISRIEKDFSRPLRLSDISARLYISCEHLIRIFHEETGMTPYQYLKQFRLRRACTHLEESGLPVGEIARAVGYRSASSFIAQFRELYGMTPGTYRSLFTDPTNDRL